MRCSRDVWALHCAVDQRTLEKAVHINFMNPTHSLRAAADPSTQAKLDQQPKSCNRATASPAIAPYHKACSKNDFALRRQCAGAESFFPRSTDEWRKSASERGVLGADRARRVSVNV